MGRAADDIGVRPIDSWQWRLLTLSGSAGPAFTILRLSYRTVVFADELKFLFTSPLISASSPRRRRCLSSYASVIFHYLHLRHGKRMIRIWIPAVNGWVKTTPPAWPSDHRVNGLTEEFGPMKSAESSISRVQKPPLPSDPSQPDPIFIKYTRMCRVSNIFKSGSRCHDHVYTVDEPCESPRRRACIHPLTEHR